MHFIHVLHALRAQFPFFSNTSLHELIVHSSDRQNGRAEYEPQYLAANLMTYWLCGYNCSAQYMDVATALRIAKQNLRKKIDVVGVTENIPSFLRVLRATVPFLNDVSLPAVVGVLVSLVTVPVHDLSYIPLPVLCFTVPQFCHDSNRAQRTNVNSHKKAAQYSDTLTDEERSMLRRALYADRELYRLAAYLARRQARCLPSDDYVPFGKVAADLATTHA